MHTYVYVETERGLQQRNHAHDTEGNAAADVPAVTAALCPTTALIDSGRFYRTYRKKCTD